jgi:hypothetical protein
MSEGEYDGSSGEDNAYDAGFETREVVIGYGAQFHDWDYMKGIWSSEIGSDFTDNGDWCEVANPRQGVRWVVEPTIRKDIFKEALEREGILVIYQGHSRHGNGACFAEEPGGFPPGYGQAPGEIVAENVQGDHWGDGTDEADGMFRLGKPFICMPLSELRENRYRFAPSAITDPKPAAVDRDAHAQGTVTRLTLPEDLRDLVMSGYESDTHQYWAVHGNDILMYAGWTGTRNDPYDLGATDMRCRCFCHFGCSTREHFRQIIRGDDYKAWQRDDPPTERFAYFTTAPAPNHGTLYFMLYLMNNDIASRGESWARCLWEARRLANARLRRERLGFQIY